MKKRKNYNIGIFIVVFLIIVLLAMTWIAISLIAAPDENKMEEYFKQDKTDLVLITEYFVNSDYQYIYINKSHLNKGTMFTGANTRDIKIEDSSVIKALNRLLKKRGYNIIGKDNNTIYFEKWFMFEESRGITYSINEANKPIIEFLTKVKPFFEDGWYYYEADYNEWREQGYIQLTFD